MFLGLGAKENETMNLDGSLGQPERALGHSSKTVEGGLEGEGNGHGKPEAQQQKWK